MRCVIRLVDSRSRGGRRRNRLVEVIVPRGTVGEMRQVEENYIQFRSEYRCQGF